MSPRWLLLRDPRRIDPEEFLAPEELAEGARWRHPGRLRQWLVGRMAAKTVAAEALGGISPRALRIRRGPGGAPELVACDGRPLGLALSIAHSGDMALAAVQPGGPGGLGVDLERVEERHPAFLEDHFDAGERRWFAHLAPPERWLAVTLAWTVKEAALKAAGVGLGAPAASVSVGPCPLDPCGDFRPLPARHQGKPLEAAWRVTAGGALVMSWARLARAA